MTNRTHVTLRVALDPQGGSIAGRVLDGAGVGRSFSGWMGLAAAIEDALPEANEPNPERQRGEEDSCTARTRTGSDEK
jgi:hypothetical protein